MRHTAETAQPPKISREFTARLDRLKPDQKVRAIVMLDIGAAKTAGGRRTRGERNQVVSAIRETAEAALPDLDGMLERFAGRRLAAHADALGCVPVEATVRGIVALASLDHVKAILEDQPVSLLASGESLTVP